MVNDRNLGSVLVKLTNSSFANGLAEIFLNNVDNQNNSQTFVISKVVEIEDLLGFDKERLMKNLVSKIGNRYENLIIVVDFKEKFPTNAQSIELRSFRNILDIIVEQTSVKNVVNIISEIGLDGDPDDYYRALQYAAVINIAQAFALRLGSSNVNINSICVPQDLVSMKYSDVLGLSCSSLTKFLLSSESNNITGQTLSLSNKILR